LQTTIGVTVTLDVSGDFVGPVPAVGSMLPTSMVRTAVPEAAVDEDGDLRTREDDVGLTLERWQWTAVDVVAAPLPVEFLT
jgi:hypothetical protein